MLIVLSKDKKRSLSGKLRAQFDEIHSRCMDESDKDYCLKRFPFRRVFKAATAVDATLNDNAKMTKAGRPVTPGLPTHDPTRDGEIRESMREEDLKNMDNN
jgi:hypothetical protein